MKSIPCDPAGAVLLLTLTLSLAGCATPSTRSLRSHQGESVVLVGEEPATLALHSLKGLPTSVRSGYGPGKSGVEYRLGQDYGLDAAEGRIWRLPGSRIPDFRTNVLHGREDFDHSKFPGFGNNGYFVFVDYAGTTSGTWPVQPKQTSFLPRSVAKLRTSAAFKIVAYGDSITAGGEATRPDLIYWNRWAADLQNRHPMAGITAVNGATGGDSTVQGLRRLQEKVVDQKPDLVLVGFGMNDHNKGGVDIPRFEANLRELVSRIRSGTDAEILLLSTFPPNPKWKHGTHQMERYAAATERVAREAGCAYADVFNNWQAIAGRKKPEDLLGNNINHPNDFGHWIYFQVLKATGL